MRLNNNNNNKSNGWLNAEIKRFNIIMHNLAAVVIPNLCFYDTHALIRRANFNFDWFWDRNDRNGIHLVFDVRRAIVRGLVNCVGMLAGSYIQHHRNCEWLYYAPTSYSRRRPN